MNSIELIYLLASFASIVAMASQLRQLVSTKKSDELSLTTWTVWTSYQCVALVYALTIHLVIYTIVNIAWVLFYVAMIALIIRYKNTGQSTAQLAPADDVSKDSQQSAYDDKNPS
jgi:L-asparagine transporter-like permease